MKKFVGTLFVIMLLICTFIFASRIFHDKPSLYTTEKVNVYLDGIKDKEYTHILRNNQIYISADYLMNNRLLDFYWDEEYHKISIFNNFKYETINYNKKRAFFNKVPYDRPDLFIIEDNNLYFNIKFVKENYINNIYTDISNLNVIIEQSIRKYEIVKKSNLKNNNSKFSKTLKRLETGDSIYIYEYDDDWLLARTEDNVIGFVKILDIKPISKISFNVYTALNKSKEINMAWDLIHKQEETFVPFDIPEAIDIIGPTWYSLIDDDEIFKDLSSDEYIKYVKESKKDIWGVFNNSFDAELTSKLLNNGIMRSQIINRIIKITEEKNFDAINIDFENIFLKDKEVFSAFIKELYCKAKEKDIIMSVDITILSKSENWSLCYDRKVIGKYSNYIMLMAYDENVSGVPGSVASLPWVEYGVKGILEFAQREKVVLSIPFYTRLWERKGNDNGQKIKSTALKIQSAQKAIEELKIKLIYDEATGQNYGEQTADGITYMIWNEDKTSLKSRIEIVKKYNLAGYAVWALSYGTNDMWNLIK